VKLERVVLTTDLSDCARAAYLPATTLARLHQGPIDLVHVANTPWSSAWIDADGARALVEQELEKLGERLDKEAQRSIFDAFEVSTHVIRNTGSGGGAEAICRFAKERGADLIVQSSHGHSGFRRFVVGSFAERVVRLATTPVLTFRNRESGDLASHFAPRRILVPYDLTHWSLQALDAVRCLAKTFAARVFVAHVWERGDDISRVPMPDSDAVCEEMRCRDEELPNRLLGDVAEVAKRELAGIDHECHVVRGAPARTLVDWAAKWDVDLVCMATRGRRGRASHWTGHVTEAMLRHTRAPVLTVRLDAPCVAAPGTAAADATCSDRRASGAASAQASSAS